MTLNICREVVQHSLEQLAHVQESMHLIKLTVDQASSTEMALAAAGTYLRTCKQTMDEAGENDRGPFRNIIFLLATLEADECPSSQVIGQAISQMTTKISPKGNTQI